MFSLRRLRIVVVAVLVVTGCQSKTPSPEPVEPKKTPIVANDVKPEKEQEKEKKKPVAKPARRAAKILAAKKPQPEQPAMPTTVSKVVLSNELLANCLVGVGQKMPEAELSDVGGKSHALQSLCGEKLTVLCLWTFGKSHRSQLAARAAMHDLIEDVVEPFGNKGVHVVGIDVGDSPETAQHEAEAVGTAFPVLLDPKGEYFGKIAKDSRMPRVFLLDAQGQVLWFDIEYSRNSRHDLVQNIRVILQKL